MASLGSVAVEGGDPRLSHSAARPSTFIAPQERLLHDPAVSFEEYHYYALKTREREDTEDASISMPKTRIRDLLIPPKSTPHDIIDAQNVTPPSGEGSVTDNSEKRRSSINANLAERAQRAQITDAEWVNASRMLRSATWAACFYLITTDILGPFGVGFALGSLGWGPGIALFTAFGIMAGYSGYLLWQIFLGLDSYEFPLKNYGDLAFRIYGTIPRHVVNGLQSIQLICQVGLIIVSNGQNISLVSKFKLCYAVCIVIWAICGFFIGQVRTLQKYGWLANAAVFINLMIMFISMGVIAHSPPDYAISPLGSAGGSLNATTITPDANGVYPEVIHYAGLPTSTAGFVGALNGLMQGVYAYGGAQLFIEFMAEMRRPRDFIKAMWGAQAFIYVAYMAYGSFVYYYQGQYSFDIAYQGVSPYGWQTAGNMLAVISGLIAAGLYGNIGIKVIYNNLLMDIFSAPPLTTKSGKWLWAAIVPLYWSLAFIIAASIPDFFGLVSVVSAFCVIQFCYSFPPILSLGYMMKAGAMRGDDGFDPVTGEVRRSSSGIKRYIRALFGPEAGVYRYMNAYNVIYAGGALATAGLGAYSAIQGMINVFKNPQITAFTCQSPLNLSAP